MPDQTKLDKTYLKMCEDWAQLSHAQRMKVGCLIVKDNQIISDGYNGTPTGFKNDCEETRHLLSGREELTLPEVLHAESNAITKLSRSTQSSEGATLYSTISPCFNCAKLIIQAGIKRVVFFNEYRYGNGINLLLKAKIKVNGPYSHKDTLFEDI